MELLTLVSVTLLHRQLLLIFLQRDVVNYARLRVERLQPLIPRIATFPALHNRVGISPRFRQSQFGRVSSFSLGDFCFQPHTLRWRHDDGAGSSDFYDFFPGVLLII